MAEQPEASSGTAPSGQAGAVRQGRRWLPWILGALGVVLTTLAFTLLENVASRNLALRAEDEASTRTAALDRALTNVASIVKSGKALFDASDDVTRREFSRIAQALATGQPGLRDFVSFDGSPTTSARLSSRPSGGRASPASPSATSRPTVR